MSTNPVPAAAAEDRALDALTRILESAISPDMLEAQQIILRRLALSGDLFPSRIPAPANITQVGGYLNLLADEPVLRAQALAAALGVAGPNPAAGFAPELPGLFFVTRANDRPPGPAQAATPVSITVRSDLAPPLDAVRAAVHAAGCTMPLLTPPRALPPAGLGITPPDDLLVPLGRTLDLVQGAALVDPTTDPLALGAPVAGGADGPLARQLDPTAPGAGTLAPADHSLWRCDATACAKETVNAVTMLPLTPLLAGAGWHQPAPAAPVSLGAPGPWHRFTNVTGLVAGASVFGDELRLLYPQGAIAASSLRERLDWVWDGAAFTAPA